MSFNEKKKEKKLKKLSFIYDPSLVLQTIQIYRTFYVFHRFACDLNLSKIQSFPQICMGSKCVAYFEFPTCLNAMQILLLNSYFYQISTQGKPVAMQTYCKYHAFCRFVRKSNLLQILCLHQVYTRGKTVANFIFALDLHARQNCCKCHTCQRFAPYIFAVDARFSNAFAHVQTGSLHAWQIYANSDFAT